MVRIKQIIQENLWRVSPYSFMTGRMGQSRCRSFFVVGRKIILTNGFVKKTDRTPRAEIDLAKKYRDEYLSRKEHNHE